MRANYCSFNNFYADVEQLSIDGLVTKYNYIHIHKITITIPTNKHETIFMRLGQHNSLIYLSNKNLNGHFFTALWQIYNAHHRYSKVSVILTHEGFLPCRVCPVNSLLWKDAAADRSMNALALCSYKTAEILKL